MLKYVADTSFLLGAQATTEMRSIAGLLFFKILGIESLIKKRDGESYLS